jgi:hypothetical protein
MTAARFASDRLTRALLDMAARGERSHCSDSASHHLWLSESPTDRRLAVTLCRHCPVEAECLAAATANQERFGVFGGKDFTRPPGKKKTA